MYFVGANKSVEEKRWWYICHEETLESVQFYTGKINQLQLCTKILSFMCFARSVFHTYVRTRNLRLSQALSMGSQAQT